jgi:cell division protein FtsQ
VKGRQPSEPARADRSERTSRRSSGPRPSRDAGPTARAARSATGAPGHTNRRSAKGFERTRQQVTRRLAGTPLSTGGARPPDRAAVDPGLAARPAPVPRPKWAPPPRPAAARPAPAVHPRLRERRRAVSTRRHSRRFRVLVATAAVLGTLLAAVGVIHSPLLDVDRITVVGGGHDTPEDIIRASGLAVGDPSLRLDLAGATRAIERLPWVADAQVTRSLPGTVRIVVTERVPVASITRADGTVALLDRTGFVIQDVPAAPADLPSVRTTSPVPPAGQPFAIAGGGAGVAAAWDLGGRGSLREVGLDRSDLRITLTDGTIVRFGRAVEVPQKLAALTVVLDHLAGAGVGYIDLSVPSAPAVGLTPVIGADGAVVPAAGSAAGVTAA